MGSRGVLKREDSKKSKNSAKKDKSKKGSKKSKKSPEGKLTLSKAVAKLQSAAENARKRKLKKQMKQLNKLKIAKLEHSYSLTCKRCRLSLKVVAPIDLTLWKTTVDRCKKGSWDVYTHRHIVNLISSGSDLEEAQQIVDATEKVVDESIECSINSCTGRFSSEKELYKHTISFHGVTEKEVKKSLKTEQSTPKSKVPRKIKRQDNVRLRRGLLPLIPCQPKYDTVRIILPEKLYRFGIVNGALSRSAASFYVRHNDTASKRVQGLFDCPEAIVSCTARTITPPSGVCTLPKGSFSAADHKKREELTSNLLKIPSTPPPPPDTSPDRPWMLRAWNLLNEIGLNSKREGQIQLARWNDSFKRIGVTDDSLEDVARREAMLETNSKLLALVDVAEYEFVEAAVEKIDKDVAPGVPKFFFNSLQREYSTRRQSRRRNSQISVGSSSRLSVSATVPSSTTKRRRRSSVKSQSGGSRTPSPVLSVVEE